MFGDLMGMMGKLKEAKKKAEETKERLDTVWIDEGNSEGTLRVRVSANKDIKEIHIDASLIENKEQLEDQLVVLLNKALSKAGKIQQDELGAVFKEGLPTIPGLDLFS